MKQLQFEHLRLCNFIYMRQLELPEHADHTYSSSLEGVSRWFEELPSDFKAFMNSL